MSSDSSRKEMPSLALIPGAALVFLQLCLPGVLVFVDTGPIWALELENIFFALSIIAAGEVAMFALTVFLLRAVSPAFVARTLMAGSGLLAAIVLCVLLYTGAQLF